MPSRILIVDGHPDPARQRLCHALAEAYIEGARSTGKETRLITVAEADFPLLRTAAEFAAEPTNAAILRAREDLLWCDHLVMVFPLWLGGAPALLRAFLEQVGRANFMAETDGRGIASRLKGRSARLIVTMGMPAFAYTLMFHEHGVRNIMQGVLGFGGISPIKRSFFGMVEAASDAKRQTWLAKARELGAQGA